MTLDLDLCRWFANREVASRQRAGVPIPPRLWSFLYSLDAAESAAGHSEEGTSEHWISTAQAAELLGVTPRQARRRAPHLGGRRIGNTWLIPSDALTGDTDMTSTTEELIPIAALAAEPAWRTNYQSLWNHFNATDDVVYDDLERACVTRTRARKYAEDMRAQRERIANRPPTEAELEHKRFLAAIGAKVRAAQRKSEFLRRAQEVADANDVNLQAWDAELDRRLHDVDIYHPVADVQMMWEQSADANAGMRYGGGR